MSIHQQVWCPWGCGQRLVDHSANRSGHPCPPLTAAGLWRNHPTVALGSKPQLQEDLKDLRTFQRTVGCKDCRNVIERRVLVIEEAVYRMP